jgi:hypothetical protein
MKHGVRKNWAETFNLMVKNPIVLMPFVFIAFLEILALEFLYFSPRAPLSYITSPIIRKFFGEAAIHYPANLLILAKLFYYLQIAIYISIGVMLSAAAVNIFNNIKMGLPVRLGVMLKNSAKRYFGYFAYGCLVMTALFLLNKMDVMLFPKAARLIGKLLPQISPVFLYSGFTLFQFLGSVVVYTLLISVVPLMVIEKRPFLKSCILSIYMGVRNFFGIFSLILLPFIIYLPLSILKNFPGQLADKLFPEANLFVLIAGSILTIFVDCFVILCASQRLLDSRREPKLKS